MDTNVNYLRDCVVQLCHEGVVREVFWQLVLKLIECEDVAIVDVLECLACKIFCGNFARCPLFQSGVYLSKCQQISEKAKTKYLRP
jgi:hypothetical protein